MIDLVSTDKPIEQPPSPTPEPLAPEPPTPVGPPDAPVDLPPAQGPPSHTTTTTTTTTTVKVDKEKDKEVEEVVSVPDVTISTPQEIISSSPAIQAALDAALAEAIANAGGNDATIKKSSKTTTTDKTSALYDKKKSDLESKASLKVKKSQHD